MQLLTAEERRFARVIERLNYENPFLKERIATEREALGDAFVEKDAEWNRQALLATQHPNLIRLLERVESVLARLTRDWPQRKKPGAEDARLFEALALYKLFHNYCERFDASIRAVLDGPRPANRVAFFPHFRRDYDALFDRPGLPPEERIPSDHLFAAFFQIRRAFHNIHRSVIGSSLPITRLRGAIWQSIFTHDMRRYRSSLYPVMGDFATLITGPSGTGKELVARAIGLSRYLAFDPSRGAFEENFAGSFHPLNLSALSPTLIESELFGHRRGAFTGAVENRTGWLEVCPPSGTVFLDEIGDVDPSIQVKLLRVLQDRTFQRMGETDAHRFSGKLIAATNRDLAAEMNAGRFREDFYYRLCSDLVRTPSLHEQLADSPEELSTLTRFVARRLIGERADAVTFADEARQWIEKNLGPGYPWPGNFRELEQCLRNLLIRKEYSPPNREPNQSSDWIEQARRHALTADQLLHGYCTDVYAASGTLEETARRLGLDRRTVKSRLAPVAK